MYSGNGRLEINNSNDSQNYKYWNAFRQEQSILIIPGTRYRNEPKYIKENTSCQ